MGQQSINTYGLPSQLQASSFGSMSAPSSAAAAPSNPLAAQGVTAAQYQTLKNSLANANAGDGFNAANGTAAPSEEAPANPLAEMFNPVHMAIGAGMGLGTSIGLNAMYKEVDGLPRIVRWMSKVPGMQMGGDNAKFNSWLANRSDKTQGHIKRFLNYETPERMNTHMRENLLKASDAKFNVKGKGVFDSHYTSFDSVEKLDQEFRTTANARKAARGGLFRSKVLIEQNGKLVPVQGASPEKIQKILAKDIPDAAGKSHTALLKEANEALEREKQLHARLVREGGYKGDITKFRKELKGLHGITKTQTNIIKQYGEHHKLGQSYQQAKLNPIGRGIISTGNFVRRAFGMEAISGGKFSADGLMKFVGPVAMGVFSFGMAFGEAKEGETNEDKAKIFARSAGGGLLASFGAYEALKFIGNKSSLIRRMGGFGMKSLLGSRFSVVGTAIEMGLAMGGSMLLTPVVNKIFDSIFGKAKTKEDAKKEATAGGKTPATPPAAASAPAMGSNLNAVSSESAAPSAPALPPEPAMSALAPVSAPAESAPFQMAPPKKTPVSSLSLDDIRKNMFADQEAAMSNAVVGNINSAWKNDEDRAVPTSIGGGH